MSQKLLYEIIYCIRKIPQYFWDIYLMINVIIVSVSRQTCPCATILICDFIFPCWPLISRDVRGKSEFWGLQATVKHSASPGCELTLSKVTGGNIAEKQNDVRKEWSEKHTRQKN